MVDIPAQDHDELVKRLTTGFGALLELADDLRTKSADWERSLDLQKQVWNVAFSLLLYPLSIHDETCIALDLELLL